MKVVSIWEGGSPQAIGFMNEAERKHHLDWKVLAGLSLPCTDHVGTGKQSCVGQAWGLGRVDPGSIYAGCHSLGGQRRAKKKRGPREEGGRERELEGRKGGNRDKERARRQEQRTKEETQEREKEERQNLREEVRGERGEGKMRDAVPCGGRGDLGTHLCPGRTSKPSEGFIDPRAQTCPGVFQDSTPPLASLPEAWVRPLGAPPLTAISRAPNLGTPPPPPRVGCRFPLLWRQQR